MATFKERVEDYIGAFADNNALSDWLTAGAKHILSTVPENYAKRFAGEVSVPALGLSVTDYRLFGGVNKDGYPSKEVPVTWKRAITDENSLFFGTIRTPSHLIYNKKLFIYMNGIASTGLVLALNYPTVLYSASDITDYPEELIHGIVLYTAVQAMLRLIKEKIDEINGITYIYPPAPSILITAVTIADLGVPPSYSPVGFNADYSYLIDFIRDEEDLEKAQEEARKIGLELDEYGKDLYDKLNTFNSQFEAFKLKAERIFKQADIDTTIKVENARLELGEYQAKVQEALGVYATALQQKGSEITPLINLLRELRTEYQEITRLYR